MHTHTFAQRAVAQYLLILAARRPIDRRLANARFQGLCEAADALGLAMTPTHFHVTVADAIRAAEPRPAITAVGSNDPARAWDYLVATDVLARLELS
jgi:hypothetical protein